MRSTGIIISLLVICVGLALGLPSWANGQRGVAVGLGMVCALGLGIAFAVYGPWHARIEAFFSPLKHRIERYVLLALPVVSIALTVDQAISALLAHTCFVPDGQRRALLRFLFQTVCDQLGYRAFALVNLAMVPFLAWLWIVLRRALAARTR